MLLPLEVLQEQRFLMMHYGNISFLDWCQMSPWQREAFYLRLIRELQAKKEAQEKELKRAESGAANQPKVRPPQDSYLARS